MKTKSILTPSRGRPDKLVTFISSIDGHTKHKSKVEMFFYIDEDDPHIESYRDLRNRVCDMFPDFLNIKFIFGKPQSVCDSWNDLSQHAIGDIVIMGNDDLVYKTPDWDMILEQETGKFPDDIYCMWFNDSINEDRHCAFPIISQKWIHTLGYCFAPRGTFQFGYNDTWIFDIAKKINRTHYIPSVMAEHNHFSNNKATFDETYKRQREGKNKFNIDGEVFRSTNGVREEHAEKLRQMCDIRDI